MDPQLQYATNESIDLVQSLLKQLEHDRDDMPLCVDGEILAEYLKVTGLATDKVTGMKRRLLQLQAEQQRDAELGL